MVNKPPNNPFLQRQGREPLSESEFLETLKSDFTESKAIVMLNINEDQWADLTARVRKTLRARATHVNIDAPLTVKRTNELLCDIGTTPLLWQLPGSLEFEDEASMAMMEVKERFPDLFPLKSASRTVDVIENGRSVSVFKPSYRQADRLLVKIFTQVAKDMRLHPDLRERKSEAYFKSTVGQKPQPQESSRMKTKSKKARKLHSSQLTVVYYRSHTASSHTASLVVGGSDNGDDEDEDMDYARIRFSKFYDQEKMAEFFAAGKNAKDDLDPDGFSAAKLKELVGSTFDLDRGFLRVPIAPKLRPGKDYYELKTFDPDDDLELAAICEQFQRQSMEDKIDSFEIKYVKDIDLV